MNEMDHAAKAAVAQLAARLGEHLRGELTGQAALFKHTMEALAASIKEAQTRLCASADDFLPRLEVFFEKFDARIKNLEESNERMMSGMSQNFEALSKDLARVDISLAKSADALAETGSKYSDAADRLKKEIDDWDGMLRAANNAHSRELDALSSELSELLSASRLSAIITQNLKGSD